MKKFIGRVISTKMPKTAVVSVERFRVVPVYEKRIMVAKRYHVHNALGAGKNDLVEFVPCKPISKTKRWIITKVIESKYKSKSKIEK